MRFRVKRAYKTLMPDIYDKSVDRRAISVCFTDNIHMIRVNYMVMPDDCPIATQITDGEHDYWGTEVEYYGYKHKPTFKRITWDDFDKMAQEYINRNGIEEE